MGKRNVQKRVNFKIIIDDDVEINTTEKKRHEITTVSGFGGRERKTETGKKTVKEMRNTNGKTDNEKLIEMGDWAVLMTRMSATNDDINKEKTKKNDEKSETKKDET
jgi:hypothetical protein